MSSDDDLDPVVSLHMSSLTLGSDAAQLLEVEWHPSRPLLATADVQGEVVVYRVARPTPRIRRVGAGGIAGKARAQPPPPPMGGHAVLARFDHHAQSCRSVTFHPNGNYAYTASADKSIGTERRGREGRREGTSETVDAARAGRRTRAPQRCASG